jgi:phosphoribosylformylglycinamidine cyclo-ligase
MYQVEDFDLAGFCVGVAEKSQLLTQRTPEPGDALIALPSSGPHANGFSLIRKILTERTDNPLAFLEGKPLIDHLLAPTRIYAKPLLSLLKAVDVRGVAHITGGGLTENIPRMLPPDLVAWIDEAAWQWPAIFNWLKTQAGLDSVEMYRTFNCGIGLVIVVPEAQVETTCSLMETFAINAVRLGNLRKAPAPAQRAEQQVLYSSHEDD